MMPVEWPILLGCLVILIYDRVIALNEVIVFAVVL